MPGVDPPVELQDLHPPPVKLPCQAIDMLADAHHNVAMTKLPTMTAQELRAIREELGLKQYEAPPLFGVALTSYKRWELGERKIPGPVVILAQKYLDDHRRLKK